MKKLKLGVIGLSKGNGHPYSWSAIFNGYNPKEMMQSPFPVIFDYLSKKKFPEDFLTDIAVVTHIWTQNAEMSADVAKASKIPIVVSKPEQMIGSVDAVLLARDDAENHTQMALPFLKAGIPIYIDKPFALSLSDAKVMLNSQSVDGLIFTCSSLRYSKELILNENEIKELGKIVYVEGSVMNNWETYGIHLLEPIVAQLPNRGKLISVYPLKKKSTQTVLIRWENCIAKLNITGNIQSEFHISFFGDSGVKKKVFYDSFNSFKNTLLKFTEQVRIKKSLISIEETLEIVEIIELGIC